MGFLSHLAHIAHRPHLRLIALFGVIVPRAVRADWVREWENELQSRELLLAEWDRLDRRHKRELLRRSASAFWDALWLQRKRMEAEVIQDLRYGIRLLVTQPAMTVVAVVTLALGIGANTSIFTWLDKLVLRQLSVEQPERLVGLAADLTGDPTILSYPVYLDLRARTDVLAGLAAYSPSAFGISDGAWTERIVGELVTSNYFSVLGVHPALGRFFVGEEDQTPGSHPVAVISHGLWQRRFNGDPAVLSRTVAINARPYTVIGIAPAEFSGTTRGTTTDLYVPTMMLADGQMLGNRNSGWLRVIGRLRPEVTPHQARLALAPTIEDLFKASTGGKGGGKGAGKGGTPILVSGSRGYLDRVRDLSLPLMLLMGVVGFVLLIACANVANLLLARASARQKEIAIRLAIGAGRWRIVRQLLTESTLVAALGGAGGLAIAYWFSGFFAQFQQQTRSLPRTFDSNLDGRILAFTFGLSILTAILFALVPALQTSKTDVVTALKRDVAGAGARGSSGSRLRHALVVGQVALSVVVLIGAGLCVKSLRALQAVDLGFAPENVVTASFDLRANGYDQPRGRQLLADLSGRVSGVAGVQAFSFANIVAFSDSYWISGARLDDGDREQRFDFNAVGPDYFRTMGTSIVQGREFTSADTSNAPPVVIVNEAAVRKYWNGQAAIGRKTSRGDVIGVVSDSRERDVATAALPTMYLSVLQNYTPQLTLHVRTAMDARTIVPALRREIQALDPALPVFNLRTLADQKNGSLYTQRLAAALLAAFALLALVLATGGIYAVLSFAVIDRTHEMGIRVTQGAEPRDLIKLVVGQGMRLVALGLVAGMAASVILARLIQGWLFGVSAMDPATYLVLPLLLGAVALVACWIPARRAARMPPLVALRGA